MSRMSIVKRLSSRYSAESLLISENRVNCVKKFQLMSIKQGKMETKRTAAVLIPLYVNGKTVSLLYTLRAAKLKKQGGQVSFPGGMKDPADQCAEDTALRETNEEMGISTKYIDVWGKGNPIIRQDMSITPVIGCIRPDFPLNKLKLNKSEVDDIFTVPIEKLCDPKLISHTQFRGTYSTPTYLAGPHRIWGLTAVMTFMFLKALLPANDYKHEVKYIPDIVQVIGRNSQTAKVISK